MREGMHRHNALQICNLKGNEDVRMAKSYEVSNSGTQNVKAIKGQNIKKGNATVKKGKDLRTGK